MNYLNNNERNNTSSKEKNNTWIIVLVLIVLPFVVEFIRGKLSHDETHDHIKSTQRFMFDIINHKVFDNSEEILEYNQKNTSEKK